MKAEDIGEVVFYPWALSPLSIQLLYDLKEGYSSRLNRFGKEGYEAGKLAGIEEVMDYFFYEVGIVRLMGCSTMEECKAKLPNWQSQLEDWGIK